MLTVLSSSQQSNSGVRLCLCRCTINNSSFLGLKWFAGKKTRRKVWLPHAVMAPPSSTYYKVIIRNRVTESGSEGWMEKGRSPSRPWEASWCEASSGEGLGVCPLSLDSTPHFPSLQYPGLGSPTAPPKKKSYIRPRPSRVLSRLR